PAPVETGLANEHQSICRGDDALCRRVRGDVPAAASRSHLVLLLAVSLYEFDAALAAVPQPAGVGCLRGQHLFDGLAALLGRRPGPGPGGPGASLAASRGPDRLRHPLDGLAEQRAALAPLPGGVH